MREALETPSLTLGVPQRFPAPAQRLRDAPGRVPTATGLLRNSERDALVEGPGKKRDLAGIRATGHGQMREINVGFRALLQPIDDAADAPGPGDKFAPGFIRIKIKEWPIAANV